jgi:hypothetical protein
MSRFPAQPPAPFEAALSDLERLRMQDEGLAGRIDLTKAEAERLAEILARGFAPTPALRKALSRLADPNRRPPRLKWKEISA